MKRIEAQDTTGRIMAVWPMDELDRAQRLVSLSESPWTIGIAEFESEAEADAKRLDHLEQLAFNGESLFRFQASLFASVRRQIDAARNAPNPTFTPIETDTKPK